MRQHDSVKARISLLAVLMASCSGAFDREPREFLCRTESQCQGSRASDASSGPVDSSPVFADAAPLDAEPVFEDAADGIQFRNLALGRPAAGSSVGCEHPPPSVVVDGVINGDYFDRSRPVFHTCDATPHQWWDVDLGEEYKIVRLRVYNRTDCCDERLHDWFIQISSEPFPPGLPDPSVIQQLSTTRWVISNPGPAGPMTDQGINLPAPLVRGRYVRITNGNDFLQLTEVEVIGFQ